MRTKPIFKIVALLAALIAPDLASAQSSTINPNVPATGSQMSSAVVRGNFTAAFNDVNALWMAVNGRTLPLAQNFILVGSAGGLAVGVPMSGDCAIVSAGAVTCPKLNGTSVPTNAAADQVLLTTSPATGSWASVPNCPAGLAYATASHTFNCATPMLSFDSVAAATAATIPATGTSTIYIRGFNSAGDAGGGFWGRSVSLPGTTARFQSADGAWWTPSLANGVFPFEIFGGQCGGSGFDNTPAMNKYNSFIVNNGQVPTRFTACTYFHNSAPGVFSNGIPAYFMGTGTNGTVLMRNYNGSSGVGFLDFVGTSGVVIKDLEIGGNAGTTVGDALRYDATSSNGSSGGFLGNVTFAGFGTNNFDNMVTFDGHNKTTGAIGTRDHNWIAVTLFGSATAAINALSLEGFTWNGGGAYPAGGTSNAPLLLTGLTAPMASTSISISLAAGGDISMDFCTRCIARAPGWLNSINSANTNLSGVGGNVPGTKNTNWINSNYLAF